MESEKMHFKTLCGAGLVLAALGTGASLAGPAEQAAIKTGCQASTNWSASACQCVSDRAASLTTAQQGFLAATLNEQKNEVTQYIMNMTQPEIMQASMFMAQAGPGCQ